MIELKKRVNKSIKDLNDHWTQTIKEAMESEEKVIDLTEMPAKISDIMTELDQAFMEAAKRNKNKGWFS